MGPGLQPGSRARSSATTPSNPLDLGLGRIESHQLGAGGMAEVWEAIRYSEYGFRQRFAVKVIRSEMAQNATFRRMFLEEATIASLVRHTNVVSVFELGASNDTVYPVMPLVEGASLATLLRLSRQVDRDAPLPLDIAITIALDAARGLHAAHESTNESGVPLDLVHRDVSPHNILVGRDGISKVANFGIAKALGISSSQTQTGKVKGKRPYLAPEQLTRKRDVDRRTGSFELVQRVDDIRSVRPSVPERIARCVARALSPSPRDRYSAEAHDLRLDLVSQLRRQSSQHEDRRALRRRFDDRDDRARRRDRCSRRWCAVPRDDRGGDIVLQAYRSLDEIHRVERRDHEGVATSERTNIEDGQVGFVLEDANGPGTRQR